MFNCLRSKFPTIAYLCLLSEHADDAGSAAKSAFAQRALDASVPSRLSPVTVGQLAERLGMPLAEISFLVVRMHLERLVTDRWDDRQIFYLLAFPRVSRIITCLHAIFCGDAARYLKDARSCAEHSGQMLRLLCRRRLG